MDKLYLITNRPVNHRYQPCFPYYIEISRPKKINKKLKMGVYGGEKKLYNSIVKRNRVSLDETI
jgi:hypothetical protein